MTIEIIFIIIESEHKNTLKSVEWIFERLTTIFFIVNVATFHRFITLASEFETNSIINILKIWHSHQLLLNTS